VCQACHDFLLRQIRKGKREGMPGADVMMENTHVVVLWMYSSV